MKKTLLATLLVAAAIPFSAHAQQGYVGVSVGQASHSIDDSGLTVVSRDEKQTAYKIYGGYNFTKNWGVEGGYADLGKPRVTYSIAGVNVAAEGKVSSFYVAATGTLPVSDMFSLHAKLGAAFNHTDVTASVVGTTARASGSGNKTSLMGGVGASVNFTKNIAMTLEYEDFGKTASDAKANMWSLGVRYSF